MRFYYSLKSILVILMLSGVSLVQAQNPPPTYCNTSRPDNSTPGDAYIKSVSFGGAYQSNYVPNQDYTDYTSKSDTAKVKQYKRYEMTVTVGSFTAVQVNQTVRVFIDWNADGDFDDRSEQVLTSGTISGSGVVKGSVTIPFFAKDDIPLGMRVITAEGNHPGACNGYTNGETEDYLIDVDFENQIVIQAASLQNSAIDNHNGCYTLTDSIVANQKSAVWFKQKVDLSKPFDIRVKINFGNKYFFDRNAQEWINDGGGAGGADGVAFVLQNQSQTHVTGAQSIGYGGLIPSFITEFDYYYNSANDPHFNHAAISRDGNAQHTTGFKNNLQYWGGDVLPTANIANLGGPEVATTIVDGKDKKVRFTWDPVGELFKVYFECKEILVEQDDIIQNTFNGQAEVFYGFTSATGGNKNQHRVCTEFNSIQNSVADHTICEGQTAALDATLIGIDPAHVTYNWSIVSGSTVPLNDNTISNPIAQPLNLIRTANDTTKYAIEIIIDDNCSPAITLNDTSNVIVIPSKLDTIVLNPLIICNNDPIVDLYGLLDTVPPNTGNWDTPPGVKPLENGFLGTINPDSARTGIYTYKVLTQKCEGDIYEVEVTIPDTAKASLSGSTIICDNNKATAALQVDFIGTPPFNIDYTLGGVLQPQVKNILQSPYLIKVNDKGNYQLARVATGNCIGEVKTNIETIDYHAQVSVQNQTDQCVAGNNEYTIGFEITGGTAPYVVTLPDGTSAGTAVQRTGTAIYDFTSAILPQGTNYHFVVKDQNACDSINITGFKSCYCSTSAKVSGAGIICQGESAPQVNFDLTGVAPFKLIYSINQDTMPEVTVNATGVYSIPTSSDSSQTYRVVDVSDASGSCKGSFSGVGIFIVDSLPTMTITKPIAQTCGLIDLTQSVNVASSGGNTFYFSNLFDAQNHVNAIYPNKVANTGRYFVNLISSSNSACQKLDSLDVIYTANPELKITSPSPICNDGSTVDITLTEITNGSTGVGTFNYYTDALATSLLASPSGISTPGNYYMTSTVINGALVCADTAVVAVQINPVPSLSTNDITNHCEGTLVDLETGFVNNPTTPSSPWDMKYFGNAVDALKDVNSLDSSKVTLNGEYWVMASTGTAPYLCYDLKPLQVQLHPKPNAPNATGAKVCEGTTGVDLIAIPRNKLNTINWYNQLQGGTSVQPGNTYTISNAFTKTYYATETNTSSGVSCESDRTPVQLDVVSLPQVDFAVLEKCVSKEIPFQNKTRVLNDDIASVEWELAPGVKSTEINPVHKYSTAADYMISLKVITGIGCVGELATPRMITISEVPKLDFTVPDSICIGDSIQLAILNPTNLKVDSLKWILPSEEIELDAIFDVEKILLNQTGVVDVNLRLYAVGCERDSIKHVTVNVKPEPSFIINPNETDVFNTNVLIQDMSMGTINTPISKGGWIFSTGDTLAYKVGENFKFDFPDSSIAPFAQYPVMLKTINEFGCIDSTSRILQVNPAWNIYVPTAFTPQGDLSNEVFAPKMFGIRKADYKFTVYNRWGHVIFETSDFTQGWNGEAAKIDTYIWTIRAVTIDGDFIKKTGTVNLIR